jgi:hypothetical protein
VNIVADYRVDDRAIGVRSPTEAKDFYSSLCVQTASGAHPASCTMGTGVTFPEAKARTGREADHSPHLVPKSRISWSYISSLLCRLHGDSGTAFTSTHFNNNVSHVHIGTHG